MQYDRARKLADGRWQLELVEVPDWAFGLRWLLDEVDGRLGHVLCGEGLPDRRWLYPLTGWLHDRFTTILFLPELKERVLVVSHPFEVDDPAWEAALQANEAGY